MYGVFVKFYITLIYVQLTVSMSIHNKPENDLTEFILSKGYLPGEEDLPKASVINNHDNDMAYILTKLNDEQLIRLLNSQPNKDTYDLSDIFQIALGDKSFKNHKAVEEEISDLKNSKMYSANMLKLPETNSGPAFYRLNHRQIFPQEQTPTTNFDALKKLHALLYNRPQQELDSEPFNDEKRELLFDVLVDQLKTLCCKRTSEKQSNAIRNLQLKALLDNLIAKKQLQNQNNNEFLFLILNEEIKSKDNEELIFVDPDTLEQNSSVLLLGPITTPLTNGQLKLVMNRISHELSKPEYTSLLQQLSDGTFNDKNSRIMKSFIHGPNTRRYIKAHRCNHQSKMARIYGGPKWLICTGYLNINSPSLYD